VLQFFLKYIYMKKYYLPLVMGLAVTACKKSDDTAGGGQTPCTSMSSIRITVTAGTVQKGAPLGFSATNVAGITYNWRYPGMTAPVTGTSGNIPAADFNNSGWFVVEARNSCNELYKDSVLVTVQHPQGTAPCSPADQSFSFSNTLPAGSFTVQKMHIPSGGLLTLEGGFTGNSNFIMLQFHPSYNLSSLPPNGVYTTVNLSAGNNPLFGTNDLDKVHIVSLPLSPFSAVFVATPGTGKLYLSREAGKLKAVVCNAPMFGSYNGTQYTPSLTCSLTQP
jgi:hypothetical protein